MKQISIFLFLIFSVSAQELTPSNYHLWKKLGESKDIQKSTIKDSNFIERNLKNEFNEYTDYIVKNFMQESPIELESFWQRDLMNESICPNSELAENLEYIRYLFRLISISYSFESLKGMKKISDELGLGVSSCTLKYNDLFGSCKPKSEEMKKFHTRVYGKFVNELEKIKFEKKNQKETEEWWKSFNRSVSLSIDPVLSRINDQCLSEGKTCRDLAAADLTRDLKQFCETDRKLISMACNEIDELNGISYADKASDLILISNAFNLINKNGYGENCLKRFVSLSKDKEVKIAYLARLIPLMHSYLTNKKYRYPQGDLFLPGALKEFDMKGLSDFLVALQPPKPKQIVKFKPKPKPVEVKKPVPKIEVAAVAPVVEKKEEIIIVEEPRISEFERALSDLKKFGSDKSIIDMDQFRIDFEFTPEQFTALEVPLRRFQTRAALQDMKTLDRMGSNEAPIGLMFIKFLMDTDNHQGLFNIQAIIGNKFFVNNDFEGKSEAVAIELKNDESTKGKWQIVILKKI